MSTVEDGRQLFEASRRRANDAGKDELTPRPRPDLVQMRNRRRAEARAASEGLAPDHFDA